MKKGSNIKSVAQKFVEQQNLKLETIWMHYVDMGLFLFIERCYAKCKTRRRTKKREKEHRTTATVASLIYKIRDIDLSSTEQD
jgi:hypothetical protein